MRFNALLLAGTVLTANAAHAADQLKFGSPPEWVAEQSIPAASDKAKDRPVALLLHDQQNLLEPGKISTYSELAFKIQKPEGLAAGNLSIAWNPAFDTATVNRLEIRRGSQVIDVLKSGQTFTTMRRESNLELAMLDGMLTANIQPEGLQEGDVVVLATTIDHVDPTLKGHVEATFAPWGEAQIGLAHARIAWPSNLELKLQTKGDLSAPLQSARDGRKVYELTMRNIDPVIDPKGAPLRFKIGRMGEASDFRSWADAAKLMQPLYREAAVIPATGPLRDEVEKIRKAFADPKARAEQALQLVQQRIRYVALSMGQGGLVPATAETTWSRRFGDCKAKTALLLAILHEYGIVAEPVLANAFAGDAVGNWLPMIGAFNHVLVRAHVGGKTYYLDGTRTGDTDLDGIDVPDFGWVLPVVENAQLVHLVPPPLDHPESETTIALDASAGIYVPADVKADQIIRGDLAVQFNSGLTSLTEAQRKEFFDNYWKKTIDDLTPGTSSFAFDAAARQMHLSMQGQLKLDWTDGFFHLPMSTVGYTPDVDRSVGPFHDAPFAVTHPVFTRTETKLRLPPSFLPSNVAKLVPAPVHSTLIGVEYSRVQSATPDGMTVQTMTRSLVPEVSYKDAVAASGALKTLADGDVSLRLPVSYRATDKDLAALATEQPGSADDYVKRGTLYFDRRKYDEAISDFTEALKLEADNKRALVGRGLAYVWKRQFAEADKDLAAVEARDSDNDVLLRARGLMAEFKDDCAKAVELYTRALTKDPANSFAIGHRATCEAALSKYDAALADAAEALKSDPAWMELRVMRANIFMRQGKRDLVAQEAEALIRDNPKSDFAWVGAGKIYAALGQKDSALKAFDRALAINQYAYIYVNRAQVQSRSDVRARLADLDAALKLEPDNADALAAKAETLVRMGKPAEAIPLYDRALKAAHDDSSLSAARAVALYLAGRTKEAESAMAVLRSKAKTAVELNNLCWKKATARVMLESAVEECREALRLAPTDGSIADSLGMALLQSGKLDEALSAYGKAVTSRTGADSLMGRAMVYARKGDRVHAEADAAAARKLYPDIDLLFADYGLKLEQASAHAKAKSTPAH